MYCTSNKFLEKMQVYIDKIEKGSNGILTFIEYIPLPYFGNTTLRFDIARENYTLADLDAYERFMQDIVEDEFLVDFMGCVYKKVGFEPWMYEEKFKKCYRKYSDVSIAPRSYQQMLINDAICLLQRCGLPEDARVWEIQIEEDIALYILGGTDRKIGTYTFDDYAIHVYEIAEVPCIGLMKAILYAKMQQISMVRVLLEV